jgi:penicillin-binding protein 1A
MDPSFKRYIWILWIGLMGIISFFVLLVFLIQIGIFGALPSFQEIENPTSNLASEVISEDGITLGTYYFENRTNTDYKNLSPQVINALISTEDSRFYDHSGIDFKSILRAFVGLGSKGGASTISQQLAKNLLVKRSRFDNVFNKTIQKLKEWLVAIRLERDYTKKEILKLYLNTVDFGNNAFGIRMAAQTYFNTRPDALNPEQAALLIGMVKGPSYYSPVRNPARALARRNLVLRLMHDQGHLTDEEFEKAKASPIGLQFRPQDHNEGLAAYFREFLRQDIINKIKTGIIPPRKDGSPYNIYRDGLKIYTTLNSTMQRYAEEAETEHMSALQKLYFAQTRNKEAWKKDPDILVQSIHRSARYHELQELGLTDDSILREFNTPIPMKVFSWEGEKEVIMSPLDSIKYYKRFLRSALLSMNPKNGQIKAWVGGINFRYFKYDEVKGGSTQVGSTFKPFLYATALENGYSPCFKVENEPVTVSAVGAPDWTPSNDDGKYGGSYTLREALARSINVISAYLIKQVGAQKVVDMAGRLGISSEIKPYPSIALGTMPVSLYDMLGAYSVFANKGVYTQPNYILRIEDKNGNILYSENPKVKQAISEDLAYAMVYMLKGNTDPSLHGTGSRLRYKYHFTEEIGGKTGTTSNYSDGWYIGITPDLVTGVWTGGEDRYEHFHSLIMGEGATTALPAWALYMQKVYANSVLAISKGPFEKPKGDTTMELDCSKYVLPDTGIPGDSITKPKPDKRLDF